MSLGFPSGLTAFRALHIGSDPLKWRLRTTSEASKSHETRALHTGSRVVERIFNNLQADAVCKWAIFGTLHCNRTAVGSAHFPPSAAPATPCLAAT